jgi:hypothetical protein
METRRQRQTLILANHVGYDCHAPKRAVLRAFEPHPGLSFRLVHHDTGETVLTGPVRVEGPVDQWRDWIFHSMDFSAWSEPGSFTVEVELPIGRVASAPFEIGPRQLLMNTLSDILFYYKGQRHTGAVDAADRRTTIIDRPGVVVDTHGGWCDATADWCRNLSHLNHSSYMNPQQAPLPVWTMLDAADRLEGRSFQGCQALLIRLREEAVHGADYLVRAQDPAGFFYEMVGYNRKTGESVVYENTYLHTRKPETGYQAGMRQGAGMTIAVLARTAAAGLSGDHGPEQYLRTAVSAFEHLEVHNLEYLNDGKENIVDDYCALLAATELRLATREERWLEHARKRAASLVDRVSEGGGWQGWLRADDEGRRPFFHASDEGLPLVALLRYLKIETDAARREAVENALRRVLAFQLALIREVVNPFQYARQLVRRFSETQFRTSFFMPHDNETRYWWQGENARLGSLATAFLMCREALPDAPEPDFLLSAAQSQIDWILGLNPFDASMLHGRGRNNKEYSPECPNAPGGIYNGITANPANENDIAYLVDDYVGQMDKAWRWVE